VKRMQSSCSSLARNAACAWIICVCLAAGAADDGGTLGKGKDTSSSQQLHVYVEAVNDVPTFTLLPTLVVQQGAGLVVSYAAALCECWWLSIALTHAPTSACKLCIRSRRGPWRRKPCHCLSLRRHMPHTAASRLISTL
jgi:hypothetical protein